MAEPLYGPKSADHAFIAHARTFEDAVRQLRRLVPRPDVTPGRETAEYIGCLLAHLIASSGNTALAEIELLRLYHLDTYELIDEVDYVDKVVLDSPAFLETIPRLFTEHQGAGEEGHSIGSRMLESIEGMSLSIIAADRIVEESETAAVKSYLTLLRGYLRDERDQ